jgi:hypothetical protein
LATVVSVPNKILPICRASCGVLKSIKYGAHAMGIGHKFDKFMFTLPRGTVVPGMRSTVWRVQQSEHQLVHWRACIPLP